MLTEPTVEQIRAEARAHYLAGRFGEAIQRQLEAVNARVTASESNLLELKELSLYVSGSGDTAGALQILHHVISTGVEDVEVLHNAGVIHSRRGEFAQALKVLEQGHALQPDFAGLDAALNTAYTGAGRYDSARKHGRRALVALDEAACAAARRFPLPKTKPKPFDPSRPSKNVIAFSLWGDNRRYLDGAVRNARLAPDMYPGWRCRFYHDDSVPSDVLTELATNQAELFPMSKPQRFYDGLFWRFHVCNDVSVERFLVRDCDSVFTVKERVAVDAWLHSNHYFHVMRDWHTHCDLVLAGMWGGVGNVLPSVGELLAQYAIKGLPVRTIDQRFLREQLWPTIKQSCLVHDSVFAMPDSVPFPMFGHLPEGRHIGEVYTHLELDNGVLVTDANEPNKSA